MINKSKALWLGLVGALIVAAVLIILSRGVKEDEVLVLCGGSMRATLEEIIEKYSKISDDKVLATYGGSGELCTQLKHTDRGDIYICHDPFMSWAEEQGLIITWDTVGHFEIVIVVPKGNPKKIYKLKDLTKPGLRIGIGNQRYTTSGVIVKHMLKKLDYGDAILKNVRLETKGHQQRCTDVAMGILDATIVWDVVARLFQDKLDIISIPIEYIDSVTSATYGKSNLRKVKVTIGITRYASKKKSVRRFYDYVTTQSNDVLGKYGF